jgi:hypothetical protein
MEEISQAGDEHKTPAVIHREERNAVAAAVGAGRRRGAARVKPEEIGDAVDIEANLDCRGAWERRRASRSPG